MSNNNPQLNTGQLKLALNLHNIQRFQTHRLQVRKSVAEHSFRALAIYVALGGTDLMAMAFHDIEESITGDIPGPIKKHISGLDIFENLRPDFSSYEEKRLGKLADKLELVLDLQEQHDDSGTLPTKLRLIYEEEKQMAEDIARELGILSKTRKLLRDLSRSINLNLGDGVSINV